MNFEKEKEILETTSSDNNAEYKMKATELLTD